MQLGSDHLNTIFSYLRKGSVIVEPGACDGQQTALLSNFIKDGRYYAIEPDERNIKSLHKRNLPPFVKIIQGAISSYTGSTIFYQSNKKNGESWTASGSCRKPGEKLFKNYKWLDFKEVHDIKCWTLDDFCSEFLISHIDLIHADIQGCERDLIEHGTNILKNTMLLNLEVSEGGGCYEGSWTKEQMLEALPNFELLGQFGPDILLKNKNL